MKRFPFRNVLLLMLACGSVGITGCKSTPKAAEENPAMTEKQKTLIRNHKKNQDE